MTVKECYSYMEADYDNALRRLGSESLMGKILAMLLRDDNMRLLGDALAKKDYETAFRAAHTLKGIVLNLDLTPLIQTSTELTESLRERKENPETARLLAELEKSYAKVCSAIEALGEQPPR